MLKVLIVDDEPKIRRGLKSLIERAKLDMEVVGEAEDGEMALEVAKETLPDILLVDICMPFLNGLQFIEQLNGVLKDCIIIVITGHDEFSYAHQAIKLQVFDYLLKPVLENQLEVVLKRAEQQLVNSRLQNDYLNWANQETKKHLPILREAFCKDWINGQLNEEYITTQLPFLKLDLSPVSGMIVLKVAGQYTRGQLLKDWERDLLVFSIENICIELLKQWHPYIIFHDNADNLVAITPINSLNEWHELSISLQQVIEEHLEQVVIIAQRPLTDLVTGVSLAYRELITELNRKVSYTPVVLLSQKHIETYYYKEDFSLQDLAEIIKISPTYLSRLLKNEIGVSFIEYLTQVRVEKAIQIMSDPTIKLYEVAERVGYSNQHYFSTTFKKVVGLSPAEYRKKGNWR
ncbi:MAG: two component transcriptional regulator, AraC family [Pelosinus sp.]|jgi:two-component system response regulator YesN|nr:two component transcriptional regulator, AraC family [Pelosinus sp.]